MPVNNEPPIVTVDNFTIQKVNSDPSNRLRYALFEGDKLLSLHGECGFAISEMIARCKGEHNVEKELKAAICRLKDAEDFRKKIEQSNETCHIVRGVCWKDYESDRADAVELILQAAEKLKWL